MEDNDGFGFLDCFGMKIVGDCYFVFVDRVSVKSQIQHGVDAAL
jgi:hypothetical protein